MSTEIEEQLDGVILKIIKQATHHFSKVDYDYKFAMAHKASIEKKVISELEKLFEVKVDRRKYKTRVSLKKKEVINEKADDSVTVTDTDK